jgi:hypothetical protein
MQSHYGYFNLLFHDIDSTCIKNTLPVAIIDPIYFFRRAIMFIVQVVCSTKADPFRLSCPKNRSPKYFHKREYLRNIPVCESN